MISYTRHKNMAAPHYGHVHVSSKYSDHRMTYYMYHRNMEVPHYEYVDVSSECFVG
jgi:hypothetical protein